MLAYRFPNRAHLLMAATGMVLVMLVKFPGLLHAHSLKVCLFFVGVALGLMTFTTLLSLRPFFGLAIAWIFLNSPSGILQLSRSGLITLALALIALSLILMRWPLRPWPRLQNLVQPLVTFLSFGSLVMFADSDLYAGLILGTLAIYFSAQRWSLALLLPVLWYPQGFEQILPYFAQMTVVAAGWGLLFLWGAQLFLQIPSIVIANLADRASARRVKA